MPVSLVLASGSAIAAPNPSVCAAARQAHAKFVLAGDLMRRTCSAASDGTGVPDDRPQADAVQDVSAVPGIAVASTFAIDGLTAIRLAQPAVVAVVLPPAPEAGYEAERAPPPNRRSFVGAPAAMSAVAGGEGTLAPILSDAAKRHGIDPHLLAALVDAESGFRADARSPKGAVGLTQMMPATARALGVADVASLARDPHLAVDTGARYLKLLQRRFGNNLPLVLAGYNAGPGAVARHGGVPPFDETRRYIGKVMDGYAARRRQAGGLHP